MNTGVGDAIDLSWKLAGVARAAGAVRACWPSYETSGGRSASATSRASRHATVGRRKWRGAYTPLIRENTPEGLAARDAFAQLADVEQRKSERHDRRRARLPLCRIAADRHGAGRGARTQFIEYTPTTWPGARLPHVWLDDGTAMQDRIGYGHGYTLLRLGGTRASPKRSNGRSRRSAHRYRCWTMPDAAPRDIYGYDLLLLRPDMHVAWRGNAMHPDPEQARCHGDRALNVPRLPSAASEASSGDGRPSK